jgi:hypothetical protein
MLSFINIISILNTASNPLRTIWQTFSSDLALNSQGQNSRRFKNFRLIESSLTGGPALRRALIAAGWRRRIVHPFVWQCRRWESVMTVPILREGTCYSPFESNTVREFRGGSHLEDNVWNDWRALFFKCYIIINSFCFHDIFHTVLNVRYCLERAYWEDKILISVPLEVEYMLCFIGAILRNGSSLVTRKWALQSSIKVDFLS